MQKRIWHFLIAICLLLLTTSGSIYGRSQMRETKAPSLVTGHSHEKQDQKSLIDVGLFIEGFGQQWDQEFTPAIWEGSSFFDTLAFKHDYRFYFFGESLTKLRLNLQIPLNREPIAFLYPAHSFP